MENKKYDIQVNSFELWVINKWRKKYRFGEITIVISEGFPIRIRRAFCNETPQDDEKQNGKN